MDLKQKDLLHYLELAKKAALKAEPILMKYFGELETVDEKYQAGLVTQADLESEEIIQEFFKAQSPDIEFLGEETTYQNKIKTNSLQKDVPRWVVDPLDGTTNYVHGFPIFCISIGLEYKGDCLLGVILAPAMKQMFYASKGSGAWLNSKQLKTSPRSDISQALAATGFITSQKDKLHEQLKLFNQVIDKVRAVRRPGAAAYDLAMIASGVFDVFWEENLNPWDTCAGVALIEEAGGKVTQFNGDKYDPYCQGIFASNRLLHPEFVKILSQCSESVAQP